MGGTLRVGFCERDGAAVYTGGMDSAGAAFAALPGGDTIAEGLADLAAGVESVPALLVSIGAPRLTSLGIAVPSPFGMPEHRLYARLSRIDPDSAHSRYNALIRRLVSFERAAACVR